MHGYYSIALGDTPERGRMIPAGYPGQIVYICDPLLGYA